MILFGDDCARFTAEMAEEIIAAKFGLIVNKANQYDELCKIGGTLLPLRIKVEEYDNVVKERDDLKKALGDLVKAGTKEREAWSDVECGEMTSGAHAKINEQYTITLAAAKKLLEEHEQG